MGFDAQRVSLWISASFGSVLVVAFVLFPGFFPPMSPSMGAGEVAGFYRDNATLIRASMITFDFCGVMLLPLFTVIIHQLKRIRTSTDVFAYSYLSAATSGAALLALANLFWLIGAFRPERDPQLVQLMNDLAWITFTAPVGTMVAQNLCFALAVYLDKGERPVFPRWVAHFNLVTAALIVPAAGASVFTSGPLAWDGLVSYWLRLATLGTYMVVMFLVLRRVVADEIAGESQDAAGPSAPAPADDVAPAVR
jgi:hypothetical protein